jgi:hypothetical protein
MEFVAGIIEKTGDAETCATPVTQFGGNDGSPRRPCYRERNGERCKLQSRPTYPSS